jgi:hypothetical protein
MFSIISDVQFMSDLKSQSLQKSHCNQRIFNPKDTMQKTQNDSEMHCLIKVKLSLCLTN